MLAHARIASFCLLLPLGLDEPAKRTSVAEPAKPTTVAAEPSHASKRVVVESEHATLVVRSEAGGTGALDAEAFELAVVRAGPTLVLDARVGPRGRTGSLPAKPLALELRAQSGLDALELDVRIAGASGAVLDATGTLLVATPEAILTLPAPRSWQHIGPTIIELEATFDVRDPQRLVFSIEDLDPRAPLYVCCGEFGDEGFSWLLAAPAGTPPGAFDLTAPPDGSTLTITPMAITGFVWDDAIGETGYTFEIASDLAFTTIIDSQAVAADLTTAFVSASLFTEATPYFWRVRADNASGPTTAANAPFTFQVDFVPGTPIGTGPFGLTESDGDFLPCFVATAAYGSPMADEVVTLRSFRDRVLMTNMSGRVLVGAYYRYGPGMAARIVDHPGRRSVARAALWPCVGLAHVSLWLLDHPLTTAAIAIALIALTRTAFLRRRTKFVTTSGSR